MQSAIAVGKEILESENEGERPLPAWVMVMLGTAEGVLWKGMIPAEGLEGWVT